ncbi:MULTISPECIES: DMT family transporter [unclassified Lentimonas]|uniref:DMT family transporter n=1 Tax=unclassified Lentimonas TaxID=2630993 RepID=UPI001323F7CD|nr:MULTISPECIES: DMT family transporter [unclassified Lentimonas]CAA6678044.1 Permease of the drug/metabolite transporter (DMT) superfamily [Lentimonas sp. CC4]CAA6687018.1 Permease of the drug/metabolite transporter (DMT) superfamily [Lentimonas sp. CC6]CAA6696738.1 Permease of the drug/metabolite transporter (DMT) superfamily [Lentimonas sp. CC10]CAA6697323.1 Permease of the drug/metabolite transporter (DMT) superfamily [Lentimonas sp. CC19]CAA7072259.1 Permease of the drug/metabolite transp
MASALPVKTRLPLRFYLQVILCALLWGSAFPVIKNSYSQLHIESYGEQLVFAGSRFALAGLLLLPFCRGSIIQKIRKSPRLPLIAIILGQTYFQYIFFYYGLSISSGTLAALLVGSGSFWWMVIAPLVLKTPAPTRLHWVLFAGCCIGIAFAAYTPGSDFINVGLGATAFLCATLSGAIAATFMKRVAPISGARTTTAFSLAIGGILLLLTAAPYWHSYFSHFNITTLLVTAYLAFLSAAAFAIWNQLIEHYSVNVLSSFRFIIPLFGVIESVLFIPGETLRLGIVIGAVIIFGCLIAVARIEQAPPEGRCIRP